MALAILKDSELLSGTALGQEWLRENRTEAYVCIPPALIITDSNGATWTIGSEYVQKGWTYFWSCIRNGVHTGEYAERIEYRRGKVYITTPMGRKMWSERAKGSMYLAPGYWL